MNNKIKVTIIALLLNNYVNAGNVQLNFGSSSTVEQNQNNTQPSPLNSTQSPQPLIKQDSINNQNLTPDEIKILKEVDSSYQEREIYSKTPDYSVFVNRDDSPEFVNDFNKSTNDTQVPQPSSLLAKSNTEATNQSSKPINSNVKTESLDMPKIIISNTIKNQNSNQSPNNSPIVIKSTAPNKPAPVEKELKIKVVQHKINASINKTTNNTPVKANSIVNPPINSYQSESKNETKGYANNSYDSPVPIIKFEDLYIQNNKTRSVNASINQSNYPQISPISSGTKIDLFPNKPGSIDQNLKLIQNNN